MFPRDSQIILDSISFSFASFLNRKGLTLGPIVERGDVWRNHDICSRLLHCSRKEDLHSSSGDGETGLVGAPFQKKKKKGPHMACDSILPCD
jgi:hypothetical protein